MDRFVAQPARSWCIDVLVSRSGVFLWLSCVWECCMGVGALKVGGGEGFCMWEGVFVNALLRQDRLLRMTGSW